MRELRTVFTVILNALRLCIWTLETLWLGATAARRAVTLAMRWRRISAETGRCPRGHEVPLYGLWTCSACHGNTEGWAFSRCEICGESAGYVPCAICGLPVRSPLLP